MSIGKNIRAAREHAELTQQAVADHFEISRNAVSEWENDRTHPDIERLPDLADLLKTSIDRLLRGTHVYPMVADTPPLGQGHPAVQPSDSSALADIYRTLDARDRANIIEIANTLARNESLPPKLTNNNRGMPHGRGHKAKKKGASKT